MKLKHRAPHFKDGDYLMQSDLTGRIMYASESRKLWNGQFCHRDEYEERNPQDFIKGMPEREPYKDARPRSVQYIDTPITADDL